MKNIYVLPAIILAGTLVTACSTQPPKNAALDEARSSYSMAQSDPEVTKHAPAELQEAGEALNKANEAQSEGNERKEIDHLAYLAKQRVAIAQETARLKAAELALANAGAERDKIRLELRTAEADKAKVSAEMAAAELEELKDLNAKKTERGVVITLGDVLFDTNKAELHPGGVNSLRKLADFFKEYPGRTAQIEGYTDSTGSESYNQDLSARRANAVRESLMSMGVSGDRVTTRGYGEENPVASNDTPAGRQMNRRVEIVLSGENSSTEPR